MRTIARNSAFPSSSRSRAAPKRIFSASLSSGWRNNRTRSSARRCAKSRRSRSCACATACRAEKPMSALKAQSSPATAHSARAMRRLDELARYSDEPDQLTRLYLTPAHKAAVGQVQAWMEEAGLSTRIDAVGNVVGRYEGTDANAPTLLIGSHIDTVRNAGKYDGPLGVIVAIEAIAELHAKRERMSFPMEVIAFGDEEGVRFPVTLTGSKAVSGTLNAAALGARDADGVSIRDALAAFGCPPDLQSVA